MKFSRALVASLSLTVALAACSGRADPPQPVGSTPPPPPPPTVVAPSVTPIDSQTVQVGQTATFAEQASGTAPLSYQWQKNGTAIAGATGASYTTPATVASDNGATFAVTVSNSAGSVTTQPATLTVTVPVTLTITQQPADTTVAAGSPATFTAGATCSAGTVTWQWQRSSDSGATFTDIAAATSATYTLVTSATDNMAEFRARAGCSNITQNTDAATLTITTTAPTGGLKLTELTSNLAIGAQFQEPAGMVFDSTGIAYLTDASTGQIKRVGLDGVVTTLAGGNEFSTSADGTGAAAGFNGPRGITLAPDGTLYVADTLNHTIRKVTTAGVVTTLAGSAGVTGTADGTGAAARFNSPYGIAVGSDGALYIADTENYTIRKVTLAGVVTTLAGTAGTAGTTDATGAAARFGLPESIVADAAGALYIADQANNTIRKVTLAGVTTTIAGNGTTTPSDAVGILAGIPHPAGLALSDTTLYVVAGGPTDNPSRGQVREVNLTNGSVSTLTGQAVYNPPVGGFVDGAPATAQLMVNFGTQSAGIDGSVGLAVNPSGLIYITANQKLRQIDSTGLMTTLIGSQVSNPNGDGVSLVNAAFGGSTNAQIGLAVDATGAILASDPDQYVVRRVSAAGAVSTVAGLAGVPGDLVGKGSAAQFGLPDSLVVAPDGTIFVADIANNIVNAISIDGTVTVYAGDPSNAGTADGPKGTALLLHPTSIVRDASGVLYVSDYGGQTMRRIATDGSISTIAGATDNGGVDVDGTGAAARFKRIEGLAIDSSGVIYAAEPSTHAIRKITPAGVVTTLAGGLAADSTPLVANFSPFNLTVAADGTVYASDPSDDTVLSVSPTGAVATVAGVVGDNETVTGTSPRLSYPTGIAVLGPNSLALTCIKVFGAAPGITMSSIYVLTLP